ncbi:TPA: CopG family ribbon-helix-helix protein [Candidatus Geothermarchaeota archaeon]|nr:CopG family ribbon-helix-helix protein [Candidatus Geothermarchaeota archaeon]
MPIISLSIPRELLYKIDRYIRERGYFSRSEMFRDAIRNLIEEAEYMSRERISSTIMITYDKDNLSVSKVISRLNHEYNDIIIESIHRHLGNEYCIDILIAEGERERIADLLRKVRGIHGVYHIKHMFIPLE